MIASQRKPDWVTTDDRKIHLLQGQFEVSDSPGVMITTTLGSCVSCCLHDRVRKIGGMNHFLLPHGEGASGPEARRYGAYAIEVLINALLREGADRRYMQGRLFGGARLSPLLPDIGRQNARFAETYLEYEEIRTMLPGSVGGQHARRIQFWPATGRARQYLVTDSDAFRSETVVDARDPSAGAVEVFR